MGESYGLLWRGFLSYNIRHDTYMTDITLDVHDLYGALWSIVNVFQVKHSVQKLFKYPTSYAWQI